MAAGGHLPTLPPPSWVVLVTTCPPWGPLRAKGDVAKGGPLHSTVPWGWGSGVLANRGEVSSAARP